MELTTWFDRGITYDQYVSSMQVNQEELLSLYKKISLSEEEKVHFGALHDREWKVIVLTADWCGDALLCVPVLKRIAEVANLDLRFLIRDENLELMDQYLTNGTSRAIPIFIFMDSQGNEIAVWGPRSPEVQARIQELRSTLPAKEDPTFEEKQKAMYAKFRQEILLMPSVWQSVKNSILKQLTKVAQEKKHA
ncbi:thioredoxin family protein [Risungbinella massiliensis]|uniref:thioredoxin family protein n=1 Tax=Risungbinella massiliensis TaxID=1329796 RepID=UPI0005CBF16F|nr:thioredoxin family protein [Risungbinella massiliensis]